MQAGNDLSGHAVPAIVNGLSVDMGDWFHVGAFEEVIEQGGWDGMFDRVERNVDQILEIFEESEIRATFFVLGWVAKRHAPLMRLIAGQGHEIASHGWDHFCLSSLDRHSFAEDIRKAKVEIENASGVQVTGYRAPGFSIDQRTPWAYLELAEQGYFYSSSVAPVAHPLFGWAEAPRFAFKPLPWAELVELPVTTGEFAGRRLAAGGMGMFRNLPFGVARWAIRQVNRRYERPAVFHFNTWEVEPGVARAGGRPLRSGVRQISSMTTMTFSLRRLLADFSWGRMDLVAHRECNRNGQDM